MNPASDPNHERGRDGKPRSIGTFPYAHTDLGALLGGLLYGNPPWPMSLAMHLEGYNRGGLLAALDDGVRFLKHISSNVLNGRLSLPDRLVGALLEVAERADREKLHEPASRLYQELENLAERIISSAFRARALVLFGMNQTEWTDGSRVIELYERGWRAVADRPETLVTFEYYPVLTSLLADALFKFPLMQDPELLVRIAQYSEAIRTIFQNSARVGEPRTLDLGKVYGYRVFTDAQLLLEENGVAPVVEPAEAWHKLVHMGMKSPVKEQQPLLFSRYCIDAAVYHRGCGNVVPAHRYLELAQDHLNHLGAQDFGRQHGDEISQLFKEACRVSAGE